MNYDPSKAHYIAITGIIINEEGKYLIAKRSLEEKAFPGEWTVPGGKLTKEDYMNRPKDTNVHWYNVFEDVLIREVKEEVNLDIKNIQYLTSLTFIRDDDIPTIIISLYAEIAGGEIELSPELTEYAWVTLEEAKDYKLIEGIYEEIEMLDNRLKGKEAEFWKKN